MTAPDVHVCGIRFDGSPPDNCQDPGAHRNYARPAPRPHPRPAGDDAANRRRWLVKMLQTAWEDDPGAPWPALVALTVAFGRRAVVKPDETELEAVKGVTVGELFGCPRKAASRAKPPWTDELNRLRYVMGKLDEMLTGWDTDATALAGNTSGREGPEGIAAGRELARAAEEVRGIVGASLPPGPPPPGAWDWLDWHLAEAARLVREARP